MLFTPFICFDFNLLGFLLGVAVKVYKSLLRVCQCLGGGVILMNKKKLCQHLHIFNGFALQGFINFGATRIAAGPIYLPL